MFSSRWTADDVPDRTSAMTTITTVATTTAITTIPRKTMTTEQRHAPPKARVRVSPLELRLYVAALLAAVYTISWRAIGGHAPATEPATVTAPTTSEPQRFAWIDSLPPVMRPAITLPAGWQLASEPQSSGSQPARIVRAPNRHVPRVRTRSS